MKLYLKQKVFSWKEKFNVYYEDESPAYQVEGELFSLVKKLHVYNNNEDEVCYIEQKFLTLMPKFMIFFDDAQVAEIQKKFTFFVPEYFVEGPDWTIRGDFLAHEYEISGPKGYIAQISKEYFAWGDTYEIDIENDADEVLVLAVVLAIDAVLDQEDTSAAVTISSN